MLKELLIDFRLLHHGCIKAVFIRNGEISHSMSFLYRIVIKYRVN